MARGCRNRTYQQTVNRPPNRLWRPWCTPESHTPRKRWIIL